MLLYSLGPIRHSFFSTCFLFSLNACNFSQLFFHQLLLCSKLNLCCRECFRYRYCSNPLFFLLIFAMTTKFVIFSAQLRFLWFSYQLLQQPQISSFRYVFLTQPFFYPNRFDQILCSTFFPILKLVLIYFQQLQFWIVPHLVAQLFALSLSYQ